MRKDIAVVLAVFSFAFLGCGPKEVRTETQIHRLFASDFKGFSVPAVETIKTGRNKVFAYTTYDEVWDSVVVVLMQECFIAYSSKESGNIVGLTRPPMVIHAEETDDNQAIVYIYWMTDLYRGMDKRRKLLVEFPWMANKENGFFDKLSTQLYSGKKWKYLDRKPIGLNQQ